ncbi:MAG: CBS domain-containing protein [Archaeoglobi archaeon]|nr:CBS domain-containing protein [Candidatus Mnemosynella sp.]
MKVEELMSSPVYCIHPGDSVAHARNLFLSKKVGRLVVIEDERPVGIITKTDIAMRLRETEPEWRRRPIDRIPVKLIMTEDLITVTPDEDVEEAAKLMVENEIEGIPVVENDELVGIITSTDMLSYYISKGYEERVEDVMKKEVPVVHRYHSLNSVIEEMEEKKVKRVIVVDAENVPIGIITTSSLAFLTFVRTSGEIPEKEVKFVRKSETGGRRIYRDVHRFILVAEDVMSSPLITISPEKRASEAASLMIKERIGGLPVMRDGELVGLVEKRDFVERIVER